MRFSIWFHSKTSAIRFSGKGLGVKSHISDYAQHKRLSTETRVTAVVCEVVTEMRVGSNASYNAAAEQQCGTITSFISHQNHYEWLSSYNHTVSAIRSVRQAGWTLREQPSSIVVFILTCCTLILCKQLLQWHLPYSFQCLQSISNLNIVFENPGQIRISN